MITRIGLCLLLLPMLAACGTVPDRYAPWRGNEATTGGKSPNLGDVPNAPNTDATKKEIEAMRQRMEADRNNAYLAGQGIAPMDPNLNAVPMDPNGLPAAAAPAQNTSGNVIYNYDPGQGTNYVYNYNNTRSPQALQQPAQQPMLMASNDPSVSIDLSVIDSSLAPAPLAATVPAYQTASVSSNLTLGQPVAYFAHGSNKLTAKDRARITELANQIKSNSQGVTIIGNASKRTGINDIIVSREINLKMSAKRANAVMEEFVRQGVSPEQIYIVAYGDSIPGKREDGISGEEADRRVEVLFDR